MLNFSFHISPFCCSFCFIFNLLQLRLIFKASVEISLVAWRGPLHAGEAKVPVFAAESWAFPVFELAAGAQPLHLQPIQEEGQAEREASVSTWNKLESFWSRNDETQKAILNGLGYLSVYIYIYKSKKHNPIAHTDPLHEAFPCTHTGSLLHSAAETLWRRPSCRSGHWKDAPFCQSTPCWHTLCFGEQSSSAAGRPGWKKWHVFGVLFTE